MSGLKKSSHLSAQKNTLRLRKANAARVHGCYARGDETSSRRPLALTLAVRWQRSKTFP